MAANIGEIKATIGADVKPLKDAEAEAKRSLGRMGASFKVVASAALAAVGAFKLFQIASTGISTSLAQIDAQSKTARRLNTTTESIQALTRAADLAGVEASELTNALDKMNGKLGEIQSGGGRNAKAALDALKLSASELLSLPIDERLAVLADRFQELGISASQQSFILREFGIDSAKMIGLLESGGDAIRSARDEVRAFGLALSDVEARQIEQANDAMTSLSLTMRGFFNQVVVKLAPYLQGIADEFYAAAKGANGFRSEIEAAFSAIIGGAGAVLDLLSTLSRAWSMVGAGATGAFNLIVQGYARVAEAYHALQTAIFGENEARAAWIAKVRQDAAAAEAAYVEAVRNMHAVNREPWPSEKLDAWVEKVRINSEEAAKAMDEAFKNRTQGGGVVFGADAEAAEKELERQAEMMARELEMLRTSLLTQEEAELESYERRLEQIALFEEARAITEQEARDMRERATAQHLENMGRMEEAAARQRRQIQEQEARHRQQGWSDFWGNMESLMNSSSKKLFQIGKMAAIANSIISAYEGFNKTMAAYPYPLNIAFAGASLAASFAKIAALKATQFGGGGSAATPAPGGGTVASQALAGTGADAEQRRLNQTITVQGINPSSLFSGSAISTLIDELLEAQRNGARIVLAS